MNCNSESHAQHLCYLKSHGQEDLLRELSANPAVECRQCGAQANSAEYVCAAHLKQDAPNVEGGHGSVPLTEIGRPHAG